MTETVIAIDGPSGAGKSTIARSVGSELGLDVLDTGAMYRAVTLAAMRVGADLADEVACADVASSAVIVIDDGVKLDGEDVTAAIRSPEVTAAVSQVSAHASVRTVLVQRQREWVSDHRGGVVEGRDIGTVVFPDALVKIFLTASDDERARRRQLDEEAANRRVGVDSVRDDLDRRDRADSRRSVSPLRPADDAIVIDTTDLPVDEIVHRITAEVTAARARQA